jgi:Leucine-rich repeat (LRR) protein
VGGLSGWSALGAFPNVRVVEVNLAGAKHEIGSFDVWPKAERIAITGGGEETRFSAPAQVPMGLQQLVLSSLGLTQLPILEGGAALRELDLTWNAIAGALHWSALLPELGKLDLGYNQIVGIASVTGLPELHTLALHNNQIAKLSGLDELKSLRSLSMANNQLKVLENLGALRGLETLNLADNKIEVVAGLSGLDKLQSLDLSGNPLADFDAGLAEVADGCKVRLAKCRLSTKQKRALTKRHGKRLQLEFS